MPVAASMAAVLAPAAPQPTAPPPEPRMEPPAPYVPPSPAPVAPPALAAIAPPTPLATHAAEDLRPVLATLESLNEGPDKGKKYSLRTPLAHVGRGAHNDIRLNDESVSETHAKLQKRDDGWYVVDMQSTNGTYVGGSRIPNERRLDGSPDVRFGGMKMRFTGHDTAAETEAKGTRAIAAIERPTRPSFAPAAASPHPAAATVPVAPAAGETPVASPPGKLPAWLWLIVSLVVAAGAWFLFKGHA